jgi:hypothetical protein
MHSVKLTWTFLGLVVAALLAATTAFLFWTGEPNASVSDATQASAESRSSFWKFWEAEDRALADGAGESGLLGDLLNDPAGLAQIQETPHGGLSLDAYRRQLARRVQLLTAAGASAWVAGVDGRLTVDVARVAPDRWWLVQGALETNAIDYDYALYDEHGNPLPEEQWIGTDAAQP